MNITELWAIKKGHEECPLWARSLHLNPVHHAYRADFVRQRASFSPMLSPTRAHVGEVLAVVPLFVLAAVEGQTWTSKKIHMITYGIKGM